MRTQDVTHATITPATLSHYSRKAREERSRFVTQLLRDLFTAPREHRSRRDAPVRSLRTGTCPG